MRDTMQEFKAFVLRGNVIDLAIAVVIGAAFGAVVTALVEGILTPLIAAIFGKPSFDDITFTINDAIFKPGTVLNALISFLSVAVALFFFVVKPMNLLIARTRRDPVPADPSTKKCPYCISEIPLAATKCAFCASAVE